jgi:translocator protein
MKKQTELLVLFGFLALTLAGGFFSGQVVAPNIPAWYAGLHKPFYNPPNEIFAPVWTALYVLMAVAAWRVWRKCGLLNRPIGLWAVQLALNFTWSLVFFGMHDTLGALCDLAVLVVALAATLVMFRRADRLAGWLLAPYLAWVLFAGVLNAAIWRLNG